MPDFHRQRLAAATLLHRVGGTVHPTAHPGPGGCHIIGCWGPLPCWMAASDAAAALRTARQLAKTGELGLLIAADPPAARHLLCVTMVPLRPVAVPDSDANALALMRLARANPAESLLGTAMSCAAALDVDAAGRRAFRALRNGMSQAAAQLPRRVSESTRHAWIMLQVTRLLFLRFVEAEGWLAGRRNFLAEEFDRCLLQRRHPEPWLLAPLFFGTLNRPIASRTRRAHAFGNIPFLNGGLFEPHPIECRRAWTLPITAWQELVSLLIESFDVTLDRGDVGELVSPELLGRVFEGMMDPSERKEAGTYYTPTELVPAVLRATLASHLAPRIGRTEAAIEGALSDRDPVLDAALLSLRILDPAVGSGAFLVGALNLICNRPHHSAVRVRHVITRRLYGVDRNPVAVRLTELRLWLELLRAMRGRTVAQVSPLPNLDTTIRAGDALHDPFSGLRLPGVLSRQLEMARQHAVSTHGADRRRAIVTLRKVEVRAARGALHARGMQLRETIADLLDQANSPDLFGATTTLGSDARQRVIALRRELRQVRRDRTRLHHDGAAPSFGIESAFAAVLGRGGFDLVVGNPPWVRGERLPPRERARLAARFRWWRGSGTGWQHAPDLSVAFVERAYELLRPGGTLGFLVPAKLATTGYAMRCRAALAEHATLHVVADLSRDPRASFDATIYPVALVTSRRRADEGHRVALDLARQQHADQGDWRGARVWPLAGASLSPLARRLNEFPTFGARLHAALGVKTGANQAFLDPPASLAQWTRPAIRGRDVRPLRASASAQLLWPADGRGTPWPALPAPVLEHLKQHRARLERRADLVSGPWWQLFRVAAASGQWRVAWSDLAPHLRAAALRTRHDVPLNSCYVVALPDETAMLACAAWLNATAIGALARGVAEPAANNHARFGARAVESVPLPTGVLHDARLAELGRSAWSSDVAVAIDHRVAHWLRLTDLECDLIDALGTPGR